MYCIICNNEIVFAEPTVRGSGRRARTVFDPQFLKQSPVCHNSPACMNAWLGRHPHLFTVDGKDWTAASGPGARVMNAALILGMDDLLDDSDLATLKLVSKEIRSHAIPHQLRDTHQTATHFDKNKPIGQVINADQMLDIAILAYHGALHVKASGKPVILYRVDDKDALTTEEKMQTLSGRIRVRIPTGTDSKEVWPIEKTAAWIQGALRAKASFLLLSDPRVNLVGGKDGRSDSVFVRELHQILNSYYQIEEGSGVELTTKMRNDSIRPFILKPIPGTAAAPVPLIPKMSRHMKMTNAWNASVSSLTLGDSPALIRDSLVSRFTAAGKTLGDVPPY